MDKKKHVIHYRNLKYYLEKGLILTKIHRGIKFKQSNFMSTYVQNNTRLRSLSKDDFGKQLFKNLNCTVVVYSIQGYLGLLNWSQTRTSL